LKSLKGKGTVPLRAPGRPVPAAAAGRRAGITPSGRPSARARDDAGAPAFRPGTHAVRRVRPPDPVPAKVAGRGAVAGPRTKQPARSPPRGGGEATAPVPTSAVGVGVPAARRGPGTASVGTARPPAVSGQRGEVAGGATAEQIHPLNQLMVAIAVLLMFN